MNREDKIARSEPKQRLLEAAEMLFAERGFDRVSVRDIIGQSGQNVAAVNYHFGDRENLIALIVSRRIEPLLDERMARLESVERKWSGKPVPVEELLDALVRPLLGTGRKPVLPPRIHHKLLGRILAMPSEDWPELTAERNRQMLGRFMRAFGKSLSTVSAEELLWRLHFLMGGMVHMLLFEVSAEKPGKSAGEASGMEAAMGRFIRFAAAGLRQGIEAEVEKPAGPQATFDF